MKKLLTIRHWQLFLLMVGIPFILQVLTTISVFSTGNTSGFLILFPIMMIVLAGLFMGWFYTLGTSLYAKLPAGSGLRLGKFRLFILIPTLYILGLSIMMGMLPGGKLSDPGPAFFLLFVLPLHLLSMFCIFYCLYFVSKALKSVELQRRATFSDYIGEFFLLWFFLVGIWILQPRINKLFNEDTEGDGR